MRKPDAWITKRRGSDRVEIVEPYETIVNTEWWSPAMPVYALSDDDLDAIRRAAAFIIGTNRDCPDPDCKRLACKLMRAHLADAAHLSKIAGD